MKTPSKANPQGYWERLVQESLEGSPLAPEALSIAERVKERYNQLLQQGLSHLEAQERAMWELVVEPSQANREIEPPEQANGLSGR